VTVRSQAHARRLGRQVRRARLAADEVIYLERWASPPDPPATCPAGAAPGAGYETWTMAGGFAGYPYLDPAAVPPRVFRLYDPADPREIIRVDATPDGDSVAGTAGPTWEVARATEGTPGVEHAAGFEVRPFITKAGMDGRAHGAPGNGGLLFPAALTGPLVLTAALDHLVIRMPVPAGESVPGSVYELAAWGVFTAGPVGSVDGLAAPSPHFNCGLTFTTAAPGQIECPVYGAVTGQAGYRWRIHGTADIWAPNNVTTEIDLWAATSNAALAPAPVTPPAMFGPVPPNNPPGIGAADHTFGLRVGVGATAPYNSNAPGPSRVVVQGARIWRSA
jgi:hypothetical protein